MKYRRVHVPISSYFITINLADRNSSLLSHRINELRQSMVWVKTRHPFRLEAVVVMPNHLHFLMRLPEGDANYSQRISLIKGDFSKRIVKIEDISASRKAKRERNIWQRRFWEHWIRDERDFEFHINYIHNNPVKHGYVRRPSDWKYSSIHKFIEKGYVSEDWGRRSLR